MAELLHPEITGLSSFEQYIKRYLEGILSDPGIPRKVLSDQQFLDLVADPNEDHEELLKIPMRSVELPDVARRELPGEIAEVMNLQFGDQQYSFQRFLIGISDSGLTIAESIPETNRLLSLNFRPFFLKHEGWVISSFPQKLKDQLAREMAQPEFKAVPIMSTLVEMNKWKTVVAPRVEELRALGGFFDEKRGRLRILCNKAGSGLG